MDVAPLPARVLVRLAAVTSTVLALGAGAHLAAAGALPDSRVVLVLAAATAVVATPLAHRRLRAATLLPVAGVWQWLLHQGLAIPTAPGHDAHHAHGAHDGPAAHPARIGWADHVDVVPVGALDAGTLATAPAVSPLLMTAAHALATVVTVALLVATERATDRALRRLAWALPVLDGPPALALPVEERAPVASRVAPTLLPLPTLRAHGCRAPPRGARAA